MSGLMKKSQRVKALACPKSNCSHVIPMGKALGRWSRSLNCLFPPQAKKNQVSLVF